MSITRHKKAVPRKLFVFWGLLFFHLISIYSFNSQIVFDESFIKFIVDILLICLLMLITFCYPNGDTSEQIEYNNFLGYTISSSIFLAFRIMLSCENFYLKMPGIEKYLCDKLQIFLIILAPSFLFFIPLSRYMKTKRIFNYFYIVDIFVSYIFTFYINNRNLADDVVLIAYIGLLSTSSFVLGTYTTLILKNVSWSIKLVSIISYISLFFSINFMIINTLLFNLISLFLLFVVLLGFIIFSLVFSKSLVK